MQGISSIPGDGLDTAGVTIIANCNMVLELVARPTSAVPYLKKRIPVYDASQLEAEMNRRAVEKGQIIHKQELLDDSPCCLKELEKGLAELCVFFTGEYIWRPSDAELLTAWKSFMSAVTVRGLHVNQSLQMSEVVDLMMEDGFTPPIIQAIFLRIALGIDDAAKGKLDPYVSKQTNKECSDGEDTSAYRNNCVPWVGSLLLRTLPSSGVTAEDFLLSWRDTLPERWREYARLELLEVLDRIPHTTISLANQRGLIQGQVLKIGENPTIVRSVVETDIPETSIKDPKDPSRWHGKFKGAG